jgi:hypothetical protein
MIYLAILGLVVVAIGAIEMRRGLDAGDAGCSQFLAGALVSFLGLALAVIFSLKAFS